jgi:aminoglycoside phosphotransferase (APT) family kinase protein
MTGRAAPPQAHTWVWAVLGLEHRRVCALEDPALAATLREAGLEVDEALADARRCDAVLVAGGSPRTLRRAAHTQSARVVAVALGGGRRLVPETMPSWLRALELAGSPLHSVAAGARAAAIARLLARTGLEVRRIATGERARRYGLGPRSWRWKRRLPVGWVVVGRRGTTGETILARVIAECAQRLGAPLSWSRAGVVESAKLMVELEDPAGRAFVLRVAGASARPPLERGLGALAALGSRELEPLLRDRIAWPLVEGEVGPVRYALERKAPGAHPDGVTPALWDDCLEFLAALHRVGPIPGRPEESSLSAMQMGASLAATHLDPVRCASLDRMVREIEDRLGGLDLGWSHGDFTRENLLVEGDRLRLVVDWDWASPNAWPLLDVLDLVVQSAARRSPGGRRGELPLALARAGGDAVIRSYCAATGTPADPRMLEGLVVGHWLIRLSRHLRPRGGFWQSREWMDENLHGPLARLERDGW